MLLRLFSVVHIIEISKKENDVGAHCIGVFLPPTLVLKLLAAGAACAAQSERGRGGAIRLFFFRKDAFLVVKRAQYQCNTDKE